MEPQASQGQLGAEGDCGMSNLLVPSPQSEAVTHEMEELSLQPTQSLPPLSERKNGENTACHMSFFCFSRPAFHIMLLPLCRCFLQLPADVRQLRHMHAFIFFLLFLWDCIVR